ncbi:MAG: hypothetical protein AAFO29_00730 [Actinomycetota bacterium]
MPQPPVFPARPDAEPSPDEAPTPDAPSVLPDSVWIEDPIDDPIDELVERWGEDAQDERWSDDTEDDRWVAPTATSQIDPARLPTPSLVAPFPPVHPTDDQAIIRLEGLEPSARIERPPTLGDHPEPRRSGTPLLALEHAGHGAEPPLQVFRNNPILSVFSRDPDQAQTLYRRQTVWAGLLLIVLLIIGGVTFPRSWGDPGPGLATETDGDGDQPASPAADGVGAVVDGDSVNDPGANRGAIDPTGETRSRPINSPTSTTEPDESTTEPEPGVPTTIVGAETSATVGPEDPCPSGIPVAGCATTVPDPGGPTTSLAEVTTSTTEEPEVVSSSTSTTEATTTSTTTTRPTTTTTRRTTTTAEPTTTTRRTTTTAEPTTTTKRTTTTRRTTTTTSASTGSSTTEATTTTTEGPTESSGTPPSFVQCQDGATPTTDCLPDP